VTTVAVVDLRGPVDLPATLEPLRRFGDDLLDRWDGTTLRRTVPGSGGAVAYAAVTEGDVENPSLRVEVADATTLPTAVAAVSRLVVDAPPGAMDALCAVDPLIASLARRHRGVRLLRHPDLFAALVRAVSAQQVNLRWAATTRRRLAELAGTRHAVAGGEVLSLDAHRVAARSVTELRELQFTTRKAEYILGAAEEMATGRLRLEDLADLPDEAVITRLCALRGIGRWTAEWVLARTLGRPVVVAGDLAVRRAVGLAYASDPAVDESRVRGLTAHWGPAAGVAGWLLIHAWSAGDDLPALAAAAAAR
jgi:DNA-3-methyladenine glycosylase II